MDLERVGRRIATARKARGISGTDLAAELGLSRGYLSRLENGHQFPSLTTLIALSDQLGISLGDLFQDEVTDDVSISRGSALDASLATPHTFRYEPLVPNRSGQNLLPFLALFAPTTSTRVDAHDAEYFRYVLDGQIEFSIGDDSYRFEAGDCFYYDASRPHAVRCLSGAPARVLTILIRSPTT